MDASPARDLDMLWFLPTGGDGRYLGSKTGQRVVDNRYLRQIAQAADQLGYHGVLLPTGNGCEDALVTAASIAPTTERLRFLVALRPGHTLPGEAARQYAALDRLTGGRLMVNVVCGGNPRDLEGDGLTLGHDERYAQADDFLRIWRGLMAGDTVNHAGQYLSSRGGRLLFPPVQAPHPPLYFGGSSPAAHALAAAQADAYLTWGEPPAAVAEKIADVRRRAAAHGRSLRYGIRLHLIVRETEGEAWDAARALIRHLSDDTIERAQHRLATESDSEGQRRMSALHGGSRERLEVSPNLWAGVGLVRGGAGTALVGDPETVAERIREYQALGIDTVIASGYPHLDEAYRVAELLFPLLGIGRASTPAGGASLLTGGGSFMTTDGFAAPARVRAEVLLSHGQPAGDGFAAPTRVRAETQAAHGQPASGEPAASPARVRAETHLPQQQPADGKPASSAARARAETHLPQQQPADGEPASSAARARAETQAAHGQPASGEPAASPARVRAETHLPQQQPADGEPASSAARARAETQAAHGQPASGEPAAAPARVRADTQTAHHQPAGDASAAPARVPAEAAS